MREHSGVGTDVPVRAVRARGRSALTRIVAALAVACLALAACGDGGSRSVLQPTWDAVTSAARDEGAVQVYSAGTPKQNDAVKAAFEAAHPNIAVTMVRLASQQLTQRADAEQSGGADNGADVVIHTDIGWFERHSAQPGFFHPLMGPSIRTPALASLVSEGALTVVPSAGVLGFAWNTQSINHRLALPGLVADPTLRGRIGVYDFGLNDVFALQFKHYEDAYGEQFLRSLAALQPRYYPSTVPMAQALGARQIDVALPMVGTATTDLPVEMAYEQRPLAIPFRAAVAGWAQNPNAAELFTDFLMSPAGQEAWAAGSVSALPNIGSALFNTSQVELADVTAYDRAFYDSYVAKLNAIFGR